jgi:hypothetical protein
LKKILFFVACFATQTQANTLLIQKDSLQILAPQFSGENLTLEEVKSDQFKNIQFVELSGHFLQFFGTDSFPLLTIDLSDVHCVDFKINLKSFDCKGFDKKKLPELEKINFQYLERFSSPASLSSQETQVFVGATKSDGLDLSVLNPEDSHLKFFLGHSVSLQFAALSFFSEQSLGGVEKTEYLLGDEVRDLGKVFSIEDCQKTLKQKLLKKKEARAAQQEKKVQEFVLERVLNSLKP